VLGEHGFAVLIERGRGSFLFDTDQGIHNGASLKKDLGRIRTRARNHGH
jgi:metal-dependent hydrolase (beta-lactamase superfamily II)